MPAELPSRANPIAYAAALWAFFFALYVLFAGEASAPELATGAIVAGLAASYQSVLRLKAEAPRLRLVALRPLLPAAGAVLCDTVRVAAALGRAIVGRLPASRVRVVAAPAGSDPASAAGRAVAIAAASLAPNSFAVAAAFEIGEAVVHRLHDDTAEDPA